jgi:uncharacterized protein
MGLGMLRVMQLTQERSDDLNWIRRYDAAQLVVGDKLLHGPCIIAPRTLIDSWSAPAPAHLCVEDLSQALALQPRILLLALPGAATDLNLEVRRALRERNVGLETMERGAACRTYNVLATEGREVVAVFW